MKKTIEVLVSPTGQVCIDAIGFHGADCENATHYLEEALGRIKRRQRKREYHQRQQRQHQQRIGS